MNRPPISRDDAQEAQALAEDACALATASLAKFAGVLLGEAQAIATAGDLMKRGDTIRAIGLLRGSADKLSKLHLALGGA